MKPQLLPPFFIAFILFSILYLNISLGDQAIETSEQVFFDYELPEEALWYRNDLYGNAYVAYIDFNDDDKIDRVFKIKGRFNYSIYLVERIENLLFSWLDSLANEEEDIETLLSEYRDLISEDPWKTAKDIGILTNDWINLMGSKQNITFTCGPRAIIPFTLINIAKYSNMSDFHTNNDSSARYALNFLCSFYT